MFDLDAHEVTPDFIWSLVEIHLVEDRPNVAGKHGWTPIPIWGPDGHDPAEWPLVVLYQRDTRDNFGLAENIEGAFITEWAFPTPQGRHQAITELDRRWRQLTNS
jgi:hypothetical protein